LEPDDVKIKVKYNTIGASDMHMYQEGDYYAKPGIAGCEMMGVIVDLGDQAITDGFVLGDRVSGMPVRFCGKCHFCLHNKENCCVDITRGMGTISEYIVWKSRQLVHLNESISDKIGSLIEPICVALESVGRMNVRLGNTVAILGGSFTGLVMLQLLRMQGARNITVVESNPHLRSLARSLGADHTVDLNDPLYITQLLAITDFIGFDFVVETTGNSNVLNTVLDYVARGGTFMLRAYQDMERKAAFNLASIFFNNITIMGAFLYKPRLNFAVEVLPSLQLEELIAEEFRFHRAIEAFSVQKVKEYPRTGIYM
jgi:(R,R)-butanediol dehydrogenase/meso-butanediol dehydrogenase/diacetyl reductase/L-iditol 2-dehydrogenase